MPPTLVCEHIVPVLKVSSLRRSLDLYTQVLGFSLRWQDVGDDGSELAMLEAGAAAVLLSTGAHLGDTPAFTGTLYFQMRGVREYFEQVRAQVEIVWPLEAMPYGQLEFGLRDVDGYLLAFAETLPDEPGEA